METKEDETIGIRLDKYLADSKIGSRAEVKKIIKKGLVRINNEIIKDEGFHVDTKKDEIYLNDELIRYEKFIYLAMNKPQRVITATEDKEQKTVMDLLPDKYKKYGLFPVGRLDKDTTGLLLLTNDGDFSHFLTSPNKKIPKTYYVETGLPISKTAEEQFKQGIYFKKENITTAPAILEILDEHKCRITIFEGKFHQVKRMFHHIDNEVVKLHRLCIANYQLPDNLPLGESVKLDQKALTKLGYDPK